MFPLASPLPSAASAAATAALFGAFAGSTGLSDFRPRASQAYRLGVPWAARPVIGRTGEDGISRFSRMEIPRMLGFSDRAGSTSNSR